MASNSASQPELVCGPCSANAAKHGRGQKRGQAADQQNPDAGSQELRGAVVRHWRGWLLRQSELFQRGRVHRHAASMAYTTTPVTET